MSRKKRMQSILEAQDAATKSKQQKRRSRTLIVASSLLIAALMSVGALAQFGILGGAGSNGSVAKSSLTGTALDPALVNPAAPAPVVTGTPQLSKEYIYAGGRMLAVEDANASAAPPADIAVWRPSNGTWYVMGPGGTLQNATQWGSNNGNDPDDLPVAGDYDGDGKTDFSVWRESTHFWYILRSSDNTFESHYFGNGGDKLMPADYDGDGKTDAAVWRSTDQSWYIRNSSTGQITGTQFGNSSDVPASADYDGDGKANIGVWRDGTGTFYWLKPDSTMDQATIGGNQLVGSPVQADYDGDGKADLAVRNGTNWFIKYSSTNQTVTTSFGFATDTAVHNDYDADGKVDIAIWRPSTGQWTIIKSSNPSAWRYEQWGAQGDIPVPVFYRR